MSFAAAVWHYWLAIPLVVGAVAFGISLVVGFLNKVVRPKYPPRGQD